MLQTCQPFIKLASNGIFHEDDYFNFALPLAILPIYLMVRKCHEDKPIEEIFAFATLAAKIYAF